MTAITSHVIERVVRRTVPYGPGGQYFWRIKVTRYQYNGKLLRVALLSNAAFSFICGLMALLKSAAVASHLFAVDGLPPGVPAGMAVLALGVGLLLFAGLVAFTGAARVVAIKGALAITVADALWVISSIGLLVFAADLFTEAGAWTVGIVALAVFLFGLGQAIGLAVFYEGESSIKVARKGRSRRVKVTRQVSASQKTAWEIVTDHESYSDVADNISRVEVLEGDSAGMRRKCTGAQGESWTEVAHVWEEGRRYGFRIDTTAPDYPYPLERLEAIWTVEEIKPNATNVSIEFDVTPLRTLKGWMFISVSMIMFPRLLDRLLGKWKTRMEAQETRS